MRRQNPPQAHLENAARIENYLRPTTIIPAYAILAAIALAVIALFFILFLNESLLAPTASTITTFLIVGSIPVLLACIFCVSRPHDPVSHWLRGMAKQWRTPLELAAQECTFKELLGDGDGLSVTVSLYYPVKSHNRTTDSHIYTYVNSTLARECSLRITIPTFQQVEEAIDPALEILAKEDDILVLYPVVRDIHKIQADYNFHEGELESAEFWRTGT